MSEADVRFRASAFGGFNRQDVITYVEETTAEYARRIEQLQRELSRAKENTEQQTAALEQFQADCARLKEEKDRLAEELSLVRGESEVRTKTLEDAQRELQELRGKLAVLEPAAEGYEKIKERSASIELDAHVRAQRLLDDTNAGIRETQARVEQWLMRVQSSYDRLCTDVEVNVSHTSAELGKLQQMLDGVSDGFAAHTGSFRELLETWHGGGLSDFGE